MKVEALYTKRQKISEKTSSEKVTHIESSVWRE